MSYIKAEKLYFKYEDQVDNQLENISFIIDRMTKTGIVGKNGCGKSTLFKIILNELLPLKGDIYIKKDLRIGYLPQELRFREDVSGIDYLWQSDPHLHSIKIKMDNMDYSDPEDLILLSEFEEHGGYSFESLVEKHITIFGLEYDKLLLPISALSGGEKTKLALCKIILQAPELILLDEPTNHLDINMLKWLEDYLSNISVPFLIISHDRKFLDNCINTVWEIENKNLREYSGNYSFYRQEKVGELERKKEEYENVQKKINQLGQAMSERKSKANAMENFKFKRSFKKNGGICKRDAGSGGLCRPKNMMKSAMAAKTKIKKLIEKEESKRPFVDKERKIILNSQALATQIVLSVKNLGKKFDSGYIFQGIDLFVPNGSRLFITGRNGCGKSTFLKILTGKTNSFNGSFYWTDQANIGYYSQEYENLDFNNTILEEVIGNKYEDQSRARTILGCFNICKDKVYQKIDTLSIGERSKVALAKIIFATSNVLVLDEPTNHLEIAAREAFENALADYTGTIICVSHDRYFRQKIATEIFEMD